MIIEEAKRFRQFIEEMSKNATDEEALDNVVAFPKWKIGEQYEKDDRVRYDEILYKVLQAHTSSAEWTPDIAVSLYVDIANPQEEFPEWQQPSGAHDAYNKGDKVTHLEKHWVSDVDNNTWEPSVFGWDEIE